MIQKKIISQPGPSVRLDPNQPCAFFENLDLPMRFEIYRHLDTLTLTTVLPNVCRQLAAESKDWSLMSGLSVQFGWSGTFVGRLLQTYRLGVFDARAFAGRGVSNPLQGIDKSGFMTLLAKAGEATGQLWYLALPETVSTRFEPEDLNRLKESVPSLRAFFVSPESFKLEALPDWRQDTVPHCPDLRLTDAHDLALYSAQATARDLLVVPADTTDDTLRILLNQNETPRILDLGRATKLTSASVQVLEALLPGLVGLYLPQNGDSDFAMAVIKHCCDGPGAPALKALGLGNADFRDIRLSALASKLPELQCLTLTGGFEKLFLNDPQAESLRDFRNLRTVHPGRFRLSPTAFKQIRHQGVRFLKNVL